MITVPEQCKEMVNRNIYAVLTSKFKKDNPEAFAIVNHQGYSIEKINGRFRVFNPETRVYVYFDNYYRRYIYHGYYGSNTSVWNEKFDFVNALNKPVNHAWREVQYADNADNRATNRYSDLRHKKWNVEYYKKDKVRIEQAINNLIKELERNAVDIERAKRALKETREKYGLKGVA